MEDFYHILFNFYVSQPYIISVFPCQIASICRHSNLKQFDLDSVGIVLTGGSLIYPKYEREIFEKLPNMTYLYKVN